MLRQICRRAYLTAVDLNAMIPAWVAYSVNRDSAVGCELRSSRFYPDLSVPAASRAEPSDYARSGYDMGHLAPAADMAWDQNVQTESFIMTNVSPQTPNLNRGAWKLLETHVRAWSLDGRRLTVYTGGIWDNNPRRIGKGVVIPTYFYKIIVDLDTDESLGFMMPNGDKIPTNLRLHRISVAEIESRSKITFPIRGDKSKVIPTWPADIKRVAAEKRNECG